MTCLLLYSVFGQGAPLFFFFFLNWKIMNMLFYVTILSFLNFPSQQSPPALDLGQLEMKLLHLWRTLGDFNHALLCSLDIKHYWCQPRDCLSRMGQWIAFCTLEGDRTAFFFFCSSVKEKFRVWCESVRTKEGTFWRAWLGSVFSFFFFCCVQIKWCR